MRDQSCPSPSICFYTEPRHSSSVSMRATGSRVYLQPFLQEGIASFQAIVVFIGIAPVPDQEHQGLQRRHRRTEARATRIMFYKAHPVTSFTVQSRVHTKSDGAAQLQTKSTHRRAPGACHLEHVYTLTLYVPLEDIVKSNKNLQYLERLQVDFLHGQATVLCEKLQT